MERIEVSAVFPGAPRQLFEAWLDSGQHAAFTGAGAEIDPAVGGQFTAWDGYIQGSNRLLEPFHRIVQGWRTTEFPPGSPDSTLEILFEETDGSTRITFLHSEIPEGQGEEYRQGWMDFYFEPMRAYFGEK